MSTGVSVGRGSTRALPRSGRLSARRAGVLLAAFVVSVALGYVGYQRYFIPPAPVAAVTTATVRSGSLVSSITATGRVEATHLAKLSFSADGKLSELNVSVGANVKAGELLAQQDTAPLQSKVTSAEAALKVAQINLDELQKGASADELEAAQLAYDLAVAKYDESVAGPTDAEMQAARAAVEQAKSDLASAQSKMDELRAGTDPVDLATAQGAVASAKAALATAQSKLDDVKAGPTAKDLETAQAAVESAKSKLTTAQTDLEDVKAGPTESELASALAAVESAKGSMMSAEDRYEMVTNGDLEDAGGTSNTAVEQAYHTARANYETAVKKLDELRAGPTEADIEAAQSAVVSAQAAYNAAVSDLDELKNGAKAEDLLTAESGVEQAQATLDSAQSKLDDLVAGPTDLDLNAAQVAVQQAQANLTSAQSKLTDLEAGPKQSDLIAAKQSLVNAKVTLDGKTTVKESALIQQQQQVAQAQAALDQAKLDLESATMTAPFDGIVSAVSANEGEQVAKQTAVVTLVDPRAFRIDVTVDETDVANLDAGQTASVTFDALPDEQLTGKVTSVAPSGSTSQGVVSYPVTIGVENATKGYPAGMSATATIETERKDGVLLVPNRAVQTQGRNRVVDVQAAEGVTERRQVQVGSSNDQMTEITSGLKEGETVVIPTTTIRSTSSGGGGGRGPVMVGPGPMGR